MQEVVGAVVIKNGKILLTLSDNGVFTPPGGKKERGESDQKCLERELYEELGVGIKFGNFFTKFVTETPTSKKRVKVSCYFVELLAKPVPHNEILKIKWTRRPERLKLSAGTQTLIAQLQNAKRF